MDSAASTPVNLTMARHLLSAIGPLVEQMFEFSIAANRQPETLDWPPMADAPRPAPKVHLQTPQMELDRQLLRDEDLLNEEHLRRMDQVLLRRNLDHARMFSRKLSLELQNFVHLYTPEANELRRRIEKYMVMERLIEKEMARRHTY
jgi:hypothetical protein